MTIFRRTTAILLALTILLPLLAAPVHAQGGDLSDAEITLIRDVYEYDGSDHTPEVEVILDGAVLTRELDYTVSYTDNRSAGTARAVITGINGYTGTASRSFTIRPRPLEVSDLTFGNLLKPYDGTTAASLTAAVKVLPGDSVTASCTANFSDPYAGTGKTASVTGITLSGKDSGNYTLEIVSPILLTSGRITPAMPAVQTTAELGTGGKTLDLNTLVSGCAPGQKAAFALKDQPQEATLSASGVLTSGDLPEELRISAVLDSFDVNGDGRPEYTPARETVTVKIVEKQTQAPVTADPVSSDGQQAALAFSGSASVTYGDTLALRVTGGSGTGAVTYTVRPVTGDASVDSRGILTPKKAGTVWVTAQKQGDSDYSAGTPVSLEVTIRRAKITITVGNKTAVVGDPVPALNTGDYHVTGLRSGEYLKVLPALAYVTQPDMSRAGTVAIRASGAAVLESGNYDPDITYQSGVLTISDKPVYAISLAQTDHGTLSADRQTAVEGELITLTALAEEGYVCQEVSIQADSGQRLSPVRQKLSVYTFLMPASPVTVRAVFSQEAARLPFTDVKTSDWFRDSVDWVWRNGLMNGTSETTFSPKIATSRGMLVTLLYRLAGSPEAPQWVPFDDVKQGAYYAAPVAWAAWNGVVNGYSAAAFGPNDPVTREQMAAIFYRYAKFKELDVSASASLNGFSDAGKVHSYARTAMAWANAAGLITGKGGGVLDPTGLATRAQAAAILQRFVRLYP